jgi:hypothetical protein
MFRRRAHSPDGDAVDLEEFVGVTHGDAIPDDSDESVTIVRRTESCRAATGS